MRSLRRSGARRPIRGRQWRSAKRVYASLTPAAKLFGFWRPLPKIRADQIGNHIADVSLLRLLVSRARMVACHCHGPTAVLLPELLQEAGRVDNILVRHQHFFGPGEVCPVVVVIDLHAPQVDQLLALPAGLGEVFQCICLVAREDSLALDVERKGVQATLVATLGQSNGVKNGQGNPFRLRGSGQLLFADQTGRTAQRNTGKTKGKYHYG